MSNKAITSKKEIQSIVHEAMYDTAFNAFYDALRLVVKEKDKKPSKYVKAAEGMQILECGRNQFYEYVKKPEYGIIKSNVHGKYLRESIVKAKTLIHE